MGSSEVIIIITDEVTAKATKSIFHINDVNTYFTDKEDMFILVVKKAYVFIIPKRAFSEDECQRIREKLSAIMGIRYKLS